MHVFRSNRRTRSILFTQCLAGATLVALGFYVVAATTVGLN